jgi:tetratricopeptide (TPR) repeat protein
MKRSGSETFAYTPEMLQAHQHDFDWLAQHLDGIYVQLKHDLQFDHLAHSSLDVLEIVAPYALSQADFRRWKPVLLNAFQHAEKLGAPIYQIQVWSCLGTYYLHEGNQQSAAQAFANALEQLNQQHTPAMSLMARIGMLNTSAVYRRRDINKFIAETLSLADRIQDQVLLGRLYYSLASAYTFQEDTQKALAYGQMAYVYWYMVGNYEEQDRTLLLLAEACRMARCYTQSGRYLRASTSRYVDVYQAACADYQMGCMELEKAQPEAAAQHFGQALIKFRQLNYPFRIAVAHHGLGLALSKAAKFAEARRHLNHAFTYWQQLDNPFEQANLTYGLGFLAKLEGHEAEAGQQYRAALRQLATVAASEAVTRLRADIEEQLAQLGE